MGDSKTTVTISKTISIIQMIAGIAILFLFVLCTIMYLTDPVFAAEVDIGFLIVCLIFDGLGVLLIVLSIRTQRLLKAFRAYTAALANSSNGFIPELAASLGASEDMVKRNLERMIARKYFPNAFFDRNANCILPRKPAIRQRAAAPEMVTVKCKGCGGINTLIRGQVGECEYCGSPLKSE